jgi:hypothetical protein
VTVYSFRKEGIRRQTKRIKEYRRKEIVAEMEEKK